MKTLSQENTMGFGALLLFIGMVMGSLISVIVMLVVQPSAPSPSAPRPGIFRPYRYPYIYKKPHSGFMTSPSWEKKIPTYEEVAKMF